MSNFIKGPWHLEVSATVSKFDSDTGQPLPTRNHLWIITPDGSFVATLLGGEKEMAEAKLITAAPEMLEALKNFYIKIESATPELRRMVNYNEIEQAIAKAEGKI